MLPTKSLPLPKSSPRHSQGGLPVKAVLGVVLLIVVANVIARAVLNPNNPAYNPADRADLDAQAQAIHQTGTIQGQRWRDLIHSASTECHYRAGPPQEYIISGTLPDQYIQPNTGDIRWYIRFPANLQPTLFGQLDVEAGVTNMQSFYGMLKVDGFNACTALQAARARGVLGL